MGENTRLRYVTDAILLHQLVGAGWTTQTKKALYDIFIIDEAHERSLNSEIVMALLKERLLSGDTSIKVVVMSATLDQVIFKQYFSGLSVGSLHMTGRQHEVDIMYSPRAIPVRQ